MHDEREKAMHMLARDVSTFAAPCTPRALMVSRELGVARSWNLGGYGNPRVDAAVRISEAEPDPDRRRALIAQAQALRRGVTVAHRADNLVEVRTVTVE